MVKAGTLLAGLGAGALLGYAMYELVRALYTTGDAPLTVQVAVPVALVGVTLIAIVVVRDRLKARRRERFREMEH